MSEKPTGPNPKLYAQMCKPFESIEEANAALQAFVDEIYELRAKHRIRDVTLLCEIAVDYEGEEREFRITNHFGSELRKLPLLAYGYGEAKAEHNAMVEAYESAGNRAGKDRPGRKAPKT
ncbi:MAG TPA: hypothetical protein VJN18_32250 [Polyangiaceae bacterium]|nr:hypothetical protein [Polyangiaceae bacterium]